jgi:hypothetical protein
MAIKSHTVVFKDNTTKVIKIEAMASGDYSDSITTQGYDHAFITCGEVTVSSHTADARIYGLVSPHSSTGENRKNWPHDTSQNGSSNPGVWGVDARIDDDGAPLFGYYSKLPERLTLYMSSGSGTGVTDADVFLELRKSEAHSTGRR